MQEENKEQEVIKEEATGGQSASPEDTATAEHTEAPADSNGEGQQVFAPDPETTGEPDEKEHRDWFAPFIIVCVTAIVLICIVCGLFSSRITTLTKTLSTTSQQLISSQADNERKKEQISELNDQLTSLKKELANTEKELNEVKTENGELHDQIDALEAQRKQLKESIQDVKNKLDEQIEMLDEYFEEYSAAESEEDK